jgi:predicted adenylyl cyclase CyaB
MEEMLLLMGFQKAVVVEKTRMTTNYNGVEICIDSVIGLGDLIELEKQDNRSPDIVRRELIQCATDLGLKSADEVKEGYDILMLRKISS